MPISVTPDNSHSIPDSFEDEAGASFGDKARVSASTAALMSELGMPFEMTEEDEKKAQALFRGVDSSKKQHSNPPDLYEAPVAVRLTALLSEYDKLIISHASQARTYIMNRLLDLSACGDAKYELRALELLGKMSDVGAFTEKSELIVTHRSSEDLKAAIESKLKNLLLVAKGGATDVKVNDVHEELGLIDVTATEIKEEHRADNPG